MSDKEIEQIKESSAQSTGGLAAEAAGQLSDFIKSRPSANSSDAAVIIGKTIENSALSSSFGKLSETERNEAVGGLSKSLDAMVKGDIPHLRERLKELGVSTKELDELDKKMTEKVEAAKPLQEAILKGDAKALQKLVGSMDPKQLEEMSELIQKNFNKMGVGLEVDYADGKLILSRSNGDRAVAISKDKLDVIGVNPDGSYDFTRHFRHENSGKELQGLADSELSNYIYRPQWNQRNIKPYLLHDEGNYIPKFELNNYSSDKVYKK